MPHIKNIYSAEKVGQMTVEFLKECSKRLKLDTPVTHMFRLVKNKEIAVSIGDDQKGALGLQLKQDLVPKELRDIGAIYRKNVDHIYVSTGPRLDWYAKKSIHKVISMASLGLEEASQDLHQKSGTFKETASPGEGGGSKGLGKSSSSGNATPALASARGSQDR